MRLIKPSPGELADRQVILELKINKAGDVNEFDGDDKVLVNKDDRPKGGMSRTLVNKNAINVAPFMDELELIRKCLTTSWIPDIANKDGMIEKYDSLYDELAEVNSQLWTLENQVRTLRIAPDKFQGAACIRAAEVCFLIADTNDKRSELVHKIDALWGFHYQEKFYQ